MDRDLTQEELNSLTQSILTRYGIDFTCYEPKSLRRRLLRVMNMYELASAHELWVKLLREPGFVKCFISEVSVGMTSMFRDPEFWVALKRKFMTEFRSRDSLRIWHAGCSTGEEVYSLAVLLHETKLQSIATALATDFNESAIREAKEGIYHKIRMIENTTAYKEVTPYRDLALHYSEIDGASVRMNPELVSHVTFQYHNLITNPFPSGFDIILCRNVMIYFDVTAKRKLLDKFCDALNPGGYFIIGFYDSIMNIVDDKKFQLVDPDVRVFRKLESESPPSAAQAYLAAGMQGMS